MADAYLAVRSLPRPSAWTWAKFKRKGSEWVGPCPIHGSKNNTGCFRYHDDGRYNCFSQGCKGRGAIDLTRAIRQCGFQDAVSFLGTIQPPAKEEKPVLGQSVRFGGHSHTHVRDYSKPLEKDTWKKFAVLCDWLNKRIPDAEVRDRYGIFCYENKARTSIYSGRVMIPFRHHDTGAVHG